jgi:hypothetical protein
VDASASNFPATIVSIKMGLNRLFRCHRAVLLIAHHSWRCKLNYYIGRTMVDTIVARRKGVACD